MLRLFSPSFTYVRQSAIKHDIILHVWLVRCLLLWWCIVFYEEKKIVSLISEWIMYQIWLVVMHQKSNVLWRITSGSVNLYCCCLPSLFLVFNTFDITECVTNTRTTLTTISISIIIPIIPPLMCILFVHSIFLVNKQDTIFIQVCFYRELVSCRLYRGFSPGEITFSSTSHRNKDVSFGSASGVI